MNYSIPKQRFLKKFMRITVSQILMAVIFYSISFANNTIAQELLKKEISIQVESVEIKKILSQIEQQADVKFVYTTQSIESQKKVSVRASGFPLSKVLDDLFLPMNVGYKVVGNRIILQRRSKVEFSTPPTSVILDRQITGTVKDDNGETLPGVSILIKGSTSGTTTDVNGNFALDVKDDNAVLTFSFVGYIGQDVKVGSNTFLDILLQTDTKSLEELVVVGYGEQSRKKLSTAISKVSGKDINQLPVALSGDALAGMASGVQVQSGAGGIPGEPPVIRIRGIGTLGASNDPLFVVDGYPLPNATEFSRINVADIESIEILKDAASAAIYGSRAANGVVMVTTRRGKIGTPSFNFSTYSGIQQTGRRMEVMNKMEYLKYAQDARKAAGLSVPDAYQNPDQLPDTDWQDEIFRTAPMTKFELSARGGSENVKYSVSGSYLKQDGTMRGTDFGLYTLRTNIDADLSRKLKMGVNFAPSYTVRNMQPTPQSPGGWGYSPIYTSMLMPPVVSVRLPNGDYGQNNLMPHTQYGFSEVGVYNPLAILELNQNKNQTFSFQNNLFLELELAQGLKLRSQGGALIGTSSQEAYIPSNLANSTSPFANITTPSLAGIASSAQSSRYVDWVWENNLTYQKRISDDHNFGAMLLYSLQKYKSYSTGTSGRVGSFTNDLVKNPSASSDQVGTVSYGLNSFISYAARINYDYRDKYLFSASVRSDGSSRFGPENRFGVFQSYSAGWRISEESFMQNQQVFSELKLRASYGETGNANIGDFTWISGMATSNYNFGNQRIPGASPSGFMNRNLTWEKNRQLNFGIETGLLKDRIYLTVDLYNKRTHGMLFAKELPALVGYATSFQTNIGEIENKGIEFDLSTKNLRGPLTWTTSLNFSFNKTKAISLGGRESLNELAGTPGWNNVYRIRVGEPLGDFYGFIIDGVIKNAEQLNANPQWAGSTVGSYQIRDVNNDGEINELDRTHLGNGFPRSIFGITNQLNFKEFDLSFILQGVLGNSIINGAGRHTELWAGRFNTVKDMVDNYFDPENPDRDVKYGSVGVRSGFSTAGDLHSYAVYKGDFLRLRNMTLGYTLKPEALQQIRLKSVRVYATAQNLFTITKYPGFNPEPSQYGNTVYQPGSDQATYPVSRSYMLGVNIGF